MDWYPLHLSTPLGHDVTGDRRIPDQLGRGGLPEGRIAETWEVSDIDEADKIAVVQAGDLAGWSLRELTLQYPEALVGRGWGGPHFPLLTKFIDASCMLPVHLHADDATAQHLEGQLNGKTEAWHILWAAPGATALCGLKPGVDKARLREALLGEDYDPVMRRLPVRPGETIYVPGGTLHSFGPQTLIYEVEQTSDIVQHAMPWRMEDGSHIPRQQQERNIDKLLEELKPDQRPSFRPPLALSKTEGVQRQFCCAGPYFALERCGVEAGATWNYAFDHVVILSNVGNPVAVRANDWCGMLDKATSLLLPAALGQVEITGPADVLVSYLPDLQRDVRRLAEAGYGPRVREQWIHGPPS